MRFAGVGELVPDDRGRPHRAGIEEREHPFKMDAVPFNVWAQRFNIVAGRPKPFRRRSNPDQSTAGPQHRVAPGPDIATNRVEYHVAVGNGGSKVLNLVVDHAIGPETAHIGMIAGACRGDHRGAKMFGKRNAESGNAAGATLDQDCLTRFKSRRVLNGPQRRETGERHRGGFCVAEAVWLASDDRGLDGDLLRIGSFDTLLGYSEHSVPDGEVGDVVPHRAYYAREVAAQDVREGDVAIGAAASPHLVVGRIDAR